MISTCQTRRYIQRGATESLTLTLVADNGVSEVVPSAVSLAVYAGSSLVAEPTVTPGSTSTAELLGSVTDGLALSEEWLEVWTVTHEGETYTFRRAASLVRHKAYPTVSGADLYKRHSDLRDHAPVVGETIRAAWDVLQAELSARGNRVHLIMEPSALHLPHLYQSLHLVYLDLVSGSGDDRFASLRDYYAKMYHESLGSLRFRYDTDEDGITDEDEVKAAVSPVIWGNLTRRYPR